MQALYKHSNIRNSKYSFQYSSSIETGLSDQHHLIISMMKSKLAFEKPKRLVYSNFKSFNSNYFEENLSSKLDLNNNYYAVFEDNFVNVVNKHASKKTKILRVNHKPHFSKTLRLAIMKHSRLKNRGNKTQLSSDRQNYKKQ